MQELLPHKLKSSPARFRFQKQAADRRTLNDDVLDANVEGERENEDKSIVASNDEDRSSSGTKEEVLLGHQNQRQKEKKTVAQPVFGEPHYDNSAAQSAAQLRFSRTQERTKNKKASMKGGEDPWWLNPPPWWLPSPPEWGTPPASMYNEFYNPTGRRVGTIPEPNYGAGYNPLPRATGVY
eukprot:g1608.t1